jgi:hypothetical protein
MPSQRRNIAGYGIKHEALARGAHGLDIPREPPPEHDIVVAERDIVEFHGAWERSGLNGNAGVVFHVAIVAF